MRIFITGASGYVGGSVAARLVAEGHQVLGLVRSAEKGALLRARGVEPVLGTLNDRAILVEAARRSDAVINAADSDHPYVVEAILPALEGSGKCFVQTSGSSIIADRAAGEPSERVFHEDSVFEPLPERQLRIAIDRLVLAAAHRGVRSVVLRPALIYGRGRGLNPNSVQVPKLIGLARQSGIARHVGRGLNVWSHLHIDDVVELYLRALAEAPAGSLFYAENGEASMKDVAAAIGRLLGLGAATREWPIEEALASWGPSAYTSYGSNSRVSGLKARRLLGWAPKGPRLLDDIEHGSYRETPASG